ncbi:MAG: serine--tRNA ligase, partial [Patescibacteria group bacterium]
MLDIKLIREQLDLVRRGILDKGYDPVVLDEVIKLDKQHRQLLMETENLRAARNKLTKDQLKEGKKLKQQLKDLEPKLKEVEDQLFEKLNLIPNPPLPPAPKGKNEKDNVEVHKWGQPRKFDFTPKDHLELGTHLGILDFPTGAKVSGSQFYFWYGDGALLELALVRFAFDLLGK